MPGAAQAAKAHWWCGERPGWSLALRSGRIERAGLSKWALSRLRVTKLCAG